MGEAIIQTLAETDYTDLIEFSQHIRLQGVSSFINWRGYVRPRIQCPTNINGSMTSPLRPHDHTSANLRCILIEPLPSASVTGLEVVEA